MHPTAVRVQERLHARGLDVDVRVFEADTDALIEAIPAGEVLEIS